MLKAFELSKNYNGLPALDALNLNIEAGEVYCLLGANGAGKTTTINLFLNFIQPDGGQALINGLDVTREPLETKKYLAYIPEQVNLYKNLSGLENLEYFSALASYEESTRQPFLERIPLKQRDEIVLLPVAEVASIVANGELLNITTEDNRVFVINYRLKDLEARLDAGKFVRLSRGILVNLEMIKKVSPMPGGLYEVLLKNTQKLSSSRLQSRLFRTQYLKL